MYLDILIKVQTYQCSHGHLITEVSETEKDGRTIKVKKIKLSNSCEAPMENEVKNLDINFVSGLAYAPLLKYSPVENLISGYYPGKILFKNF